MFTFILNAEDVFELVLLPFCIRALEFDTIPFKFDNEEPFIDVLLMILLLGNGLDEDELLFIASKLVAFVVVVAVVVLFFNVELNEDVFEAEEDMLRLFICLLALFDFEKFCDCSAIMFSRVGCFSPLQFNRKKH